MWVVGLAGWAACAVPPSPLRAQSASASAPASAAAGGHRIAERGGEGTLARRATQADADAALRALNQLLDAYQTGDLAGFDALLANTLPGRQRLVEGFMRGLAEQRNTRVHLFDVQVTAGPDVAAIQAGWEKRSLASAGFTPQLERGRFNLLARRAAGGAGWVLTAIEGDNPFAPGASTAVGARLTLGAAAIGIAGLSTRCPGTIPVATEATPVAGSLAGSAIFAAGALGTTTTLSGSLTGPRIGSVPVSVPGYALTLSAASAPASALAVPVSVPLTGSATGAAGGPLSVVATGPAFSAAVSFPDPTVGPPGIGVEGTLSGSVTTSRNTLGASGVLSGTLMGTGLSPIALNLVPVELSLSTVTNEPPFPQQTVQLSIPVTATLARQENGRYAGIATGRAFARFTWAPGGAGAVASGIVSGPVSVAVRGATLLPRPPISGQVSGPAVELRPVVGAAGPPCTPVPLSIEVQSAALQGQGGVTVQMTTDQGDREVLSLTELAPGRFARSTVPMARTGGVRPGNGIVDAVDPGSSVTVTFIDTAALPGRTPVRSLTATFRIQ
jgi:hypothetical protein